MPSIPITNDLFRFVTLKAPNLITIEKKDQYSITHPNFESSFIAQLISDSNGETVTKADIISAFRTNAISTLDALKNFNLPLYKFAENKFKLNSEDEELPEPLTSDQIVEIWDNLLYQIVSKENSNIRQGCINLLKANKKVSNIPSGRGPADFVVNVDDQDFVLVPKDMVNLLDKWYLDNCNGNIYGVKNLGVADYRRVEQEICCYVPGEVSHIENILAKEYKEKSTRNLVKSEVSVETLKESEIEHLKDTATTSRNELHSEIASVMEQDRNMDLGANVGYTSKLGAGQISADASFGFASSNSSTLSNTAAKEYAQEITNRAVDRILQRTSEKRTSRIIKEFEENNKHGFDNRSGEQHVTGIYRWVDIIYKNRIVNYGRRLMLEFMIPEPAAFYKTILNYKALTQEQIDEQQNNESGGRPKTLSELGINSSADIKRDNYSAIAQNFGITLNAPLDEFVIVSKTIQTPHVKDSDNGSKNGVDNIVIPQDYQADSLTGKTDVTYTWHKVGGGASPSYNMDIGNFNVNFGGLFSKGNKNKLVTKSFGTNFTTKYTTSIGVTLDYKKVNDSTTNLDVKCKLTDSKFLEWQNDCYQKLLDAYNNANDTFESNNEDEAETTEEKKYKNPAMNRVIEQRELKRFCIEMVTKPFCREIGQDFIIEEDACDSKYIIPHVAQSELYENYITQVKFLEQAIDWQLMSYLFYPYYWANKCKWGDLMQCEDDDLLFQAFLQSGMARVVVPIRLEMTEAALYYLRTGDIWTGGDLIPGTDDDLYISIMDEMQAPLGVVEGSEWETRLPSTLTIVQNKNAKLMEEGLPCCPSDSENPNTIVESTETLSLLTPNP